MSKKPRVGKKYLINYLMQEKGFTQVEAEKAVDGVLAGTIEALLAGVMVVISNFGTLHPETMPPRVVRNPQTGVKRVSAPRKVVRWRSSPTFLGVLNGEADRDLVTKAPKTPRKG